MNIIIRKETQEDHYNTEHMVLRAFWNLHGPGCNEHLLVHKLREAEEYLPELSRVAEVDGRIVGAIFASRSTVVDGDQVHEVLTFGPLAVEPTLFASGVGAELLHTFIELARETGFPGIVITGEPDYYPKFGFRTCDHFGIVHPAFGNADAFMALPLNEDFALVHGTFYEAPVFETCEDASEIEAYTRQFPYYKPLRLSCQWLHKEKLGRIAEVRKNSYIIQFWEQELPAKLKGSFYEQDADQLPIVGDYVTFQYNRTGDSIILSVCERAGLLRRPDQSKTGVSQYMAANVDYLFIVTALNEDYSYNRIARYASVALQGGAVPVAILTKADLSDDIDRYIMEVETISEKIHVHAVSSLFGIGMEALEEYLQPGNTICFMGSSGAGKSTLLNAVLGANVMKTAEVRSSDSKGRHTTTHRQLILLENGVSIIDTPGMREIGMAGVEQGIEDTFSDIVELEKQCRFSDCKHETEPGCAVRAAIERGELSEERLMLYQNLGTENTRNYAKKKQISKWAKAYKKNKNKNNWD